MLDWCCWDLGITLSSGRCLPALLPPPFYAYAFSLLFFIIVLSPSLRCIWQGPWDQGLSCLGCDVLLHCTADRAWLAKSGVEVPSLHHHWHCFLSWLLPWIRTGGFSKQKEYVLWLVVVHRSGRKGNLHSHLVLLMRSLWVGGFWSVPWPFLKGAVATIFRVLLVFFVYHGTLHLHFSSQGLSS